jgi:hypothetical protein
MRMRCRIIQAQLHLLPNSLKGTTLKVVWPSTDSTSNDLLSQPST